MKTEQEIKDQFMGLVSSNKEILDQPLAEIAINAPLALMQLEIKARLDVFAWVLGEDRPEFPADKPAGGKK